MKFDTAYHQDLLNLDEGWEFTNGELVPWEPVVGVRTSLHHHMTRHVTSFSILLH